jgi:hypothetical protein
MMLLPPSLGTDFLSDSLGHGNEREGSLRCGSVPWLQISFGPSTQCIKYNCKLLSFHICEVAEGG